MPSKHARDDTVVRTATYLSQRSLFVLAWILLLASFFLPVPTHLYPVAETGLSGLKWLGDDLLAGPAGVSAGWVVGKTVYWGRQPTGAADALGFGQLIALTLAYFANVGFLAGLFLQNARRPSLPSRLFLVGAVLAGGAAAVALPDFASLPGYWLWLAALATLAWAFTGFEGKGMDAASNFTRAMAMHSDTGSMPLVVWMWLGLTCFWLALAYMATTHRSPAEERDASGDSRRARTVDSFVHDPGQLVDAAQAAVWGEALAEFEKATSHQVAFAIYPRLPGGSIEEFCIDVAEHSPLGRKGVDNGIILFVFMAERTARLEVGYGFEDVLSDALAHDILEQRLLPAFARGQFSEGVDSTLRTVLATLERVPGRATQPRTLATLWTQVRVATPRIVAGTYPALSGLGFLPRLGISLFGGVFATIAFYVLRQVVATLAYLLSGARRGQVKLGAPSAPLREQLELVGFTAEMAIFAGALALGAMASIAGAVVVAGGGGFGGAGALVHW